MRQELKYPEDRALHFVKRFDHNNDGRLSAVEFGQFRNKVEEAYAFTRADFCLINTFHLIHVVHYLLLWTSSKSLTLSNVFCVKKTKVQL